MYLGHYVEGISYIHHQYSDIHADEVSEHGMRRNPVGRDAHIPVQKQVISRSEHAPEQREQRADYPADIAPSLRVIPQLDFHDVDKKQPRDILDARHNSGDYEYNHHMPPELRAYTVERYLADGIEQHHARAVQRQAGSDEKAGVYPLAVRVPPVKQLEHPAERAADDEQKRNLEQYLHYYYVPSDFLRLRFMTASVTAEPAMNTRLTANGIRNSGEPGVDALVPRIGKVTISGIKPMMQAGR